MTLEELKAEAAKHGYNLVKKQHYVRLNKCPVCGRRPALMVSAVTGKKRYYCCKIHSEWIKGEENARMAWNQVTGEYKNDN